MPKTKKRSVSFISTFKDLKKLINTLISCKFKEMFLKNQRQACTDVVKIYWDKSYVQNKEIEMLRRAWIHNKQDIRDWYDKMVKGLFQKLFFF